MNCERLYRTAKAIQQPKLFRGLETYASSGTSYMCMEWPDAANFLWLAIPPPTPERFPSNFKANQLTYL